MKHLQPDSPRIDVIAVPLRAAETDPEWPPNDVLAAHRIPGSNDWRVSLPRLGYDLYGANGGDIGLLRSTSTEPPWRVLNKIAQDVIDYVNGNEVLRITQRNAIDDAIDQARREAERESEPAPTGPRVAITECHHLSRTGAGKNHEGQRGILHGNYIRLDDGRDIDLSGHSIETENA